MSDRENTKRCRVRIPRVLLGAAIAAAATGCGPAAVEEARCEQIAERGLCVERADFEAVRALCAEVGRYSVQPCRIEEVVASCDQVVTRRDGSDEHVTSYYYRRDPEDVERILAECRAQPRSQGWPGLPGS